MTKLHRASEDQYLVRVPNPTPSKHCVYGCFSADLSFTIGCVIRAPALLDRWYIPTVAFRVMVIKLSESIKLPPEHRIHSLIPLFFYIVAQRGIWIRANNAPEIVRCDIGIIG